MAVGSDIDGHRSFELHREGISRCERLHLRQRDGVERGGWVVRDDLPPEAPSFITRVCGFGFHILRRKFEQARRARSPQIAQALCALQRVFGFPAMSAV